MIDPDPARIDATFRNGSLTAISVVLGFSLSFLSRWAGLPGQWHMGDLAAVLLIVLGITLQIFAMAAMLWVSSLKVSAYDRAMRTFLIGLALVSGGVALAIVGDVTGYGQHVLG
jgi:hypothetical protein